MCRDLKRSRGRIFQTDGTANASFWGRNKLGLLIRKTKSVQCKKDEDPEVGDLPNPDQEFGFYSLNDGKSS